MAEHKKRAVVSYEKMSEELQLAFAEKYPRGLIDYLPDVQKISKPDGTFIYTVQVELPTAIYLVKVNIKVDDTEDLDRWLEESNGDTEDENQGEALPDDNISQYSTDDDSADTDE